MYMFGKHSQERSRKPMRDIPLFMMKNILESPNATHVSLTLPKQKEEYTSKTLFAFFDGLIPEGWLLNIVTHNWKLNPSDRFGILLVACRDSIGNVSIREVKE